MRETFKRYYRLTKPGIIYGNDLSVLMGLALASIHFHTFQPLALVTGLVGISLVMASGCVFNNYIDRDIDAKMKRTKGRSLVQGDISAQAALTYGTVLGLLGVGLLTLGTNLLTVLFALAGFIAYVFLYAVAKRKTIYGTEVGSISGAIPPVVGYISISNQLDSGAIILFGLLTLWQMPHFFAIAMYRLKDYKTAGIPVRPTQMGMFRTKITILSYIVLFTLFTPLLTIFGYTGYLYAICMIAIGVVWFVKGFRTFSLPNDSAWGRKMFLFSLTVLLSLCILVPLGAALP